MCVVGEILVDLVTRRIFDVLNVTARWSVPSRSKVEAKSEDTVRSPGRSVLAGRHVPFSKF